MSSWGNAFCNEVREGMEQRAAISTQRAGEGENHTSRRRRSKGPNVAEKQL